jgi:sugar phosphate isomerase/epimerase
VSRIVSIAAGVCPDVAAPDFVVAAAAAGWDACGVWFDASTWTDRTADEVRRRLDDTGTVALDIEPVFVRPEGDHGDRVIDAAAAIGARNVLVVARGVEAEQFADRFAELCNRAANHGVGCSVEFMAFMSIRSLPESLAVLDVIDRPNAAVLLDNLHVARTGATVDDVAAIAPARLPYAQLCDAPAVAPDDLYTEAVDGRLLPGDGGLPVAEFVDALPPETDLSIEVRSAELRTAFPDPIDRARRTLDATDRFLEAMS